MTRIFDDAELARLATPLSITLERAVEARDASLLPWIAEQADLECLWIYDAYVPWIGTLQRLIVDRGGQVAHDLALTWVQESGVRPFVRHFEGLDDRERVERVGMMLRASGSTFDVEERDDVVRFHLSSWGAARWWRQPAAWQADGTNRHRVGDRIEYPRHGQYGPPTSFPLLTGARPMTRGRAELPANLAFEVLFWETVPIELYGRPLAIIGLGDGPEDPVTLDVPKDGADVPEEVYTANGLAKPQVPAGSPTARVFTDEELERIATPLSVRVANAAAAGDWDALAALASRWDEELVIAKDPLGVSIGALLTWITRRYGEAGLEQALVDTADVVMAPFIDTVRDMSSVDSIRAWSIAWRAHGSTFSIEEQDERFLFSGQPLGHCARLWATAEPYEIRRVSDDRVRYPSFGSYDAPHSFAVTREPRPITHGKVGYPVYSCHCVMLHEIYPIDQLGHPLWVEEHPLDDHDGDTVHIHYKDPADWPERYYEAVGRTKPAAIG
ncbi:MAG: hypothetical protein AB7G37_03885 [Solirubrobacteraceae bacterium]